MVEALWADIGRSRSVQKGVGYFQRKFLGEGDVITQPVCARKLET